MHMYTKCWFLLPVRGKIGGGIEEEGEEERELTPCSPGPAQYQRAFPPGLLVVY